MIGDWQKLVLASLLALPLAVVSGAHALSSASLRKAPDLSLAIFPWNGLAKEKISYQTMVSNVRPVGRVTENDAEASARQDEQQSQRLAIGELAGFATQVSAAAKDALRLEPLLPRAHTILALSQTDPDRRRSMVDLSSRLNRRDLPLQGLVLEQKVANRDYEGSMETLDQILRVHPERQAEFFPLLIAALARDATLPAFTDLLSKPLPWRDAFLNAAVRNQNVLMNLAEIRQQVAIDNTEFDRQLIGRLADTGNIAEAESIYRRVSGTARTDSLAWPSNYPPFDWKLADRSGFRAQPSPGQDLLEIDVGPGNGGVIGSRVVAALKPPFSLRLSHSIEPVSQLKDVKVSLNCWGAADAFFERSLSAGDNVYSVSEAPSCPYFAISISARSWSGTRPLRGSFRSVTISVP